MWKYIKKRRAAKGATPDWMRWSLWAFVLYLLYTGFYNEAVHEPGRDDNNPQTRLPTLDHYPAIEKAADIDHWKKLFNPGLGKDIEVRDLSKGEGDFAGCGQRVTLEVSAPADGELPPEIASGSHEFTIGSGTPPALDRAVRGMREGGSRAVEAGPRLLDPQADGTEAEGRFVLTLEKLTPNVREGLEFSYTDRQEGIGVPVSCGEQVAVYVAIFNSKGEKLFESPEDTPLRFRLGEGRYGHGLDRGLIGLTVGGMRRLLIPPAYQNNELPFPKNEIAIVEVMRVPYKEKKARMRPVILPEVELPKERKNEPVIKQKRDEPADER